MNSEQLEVIKIRANAATQGKWEWIKDERDVNVMAILKSEDIEIMNFGNSEPFCQIEGTSPKSNDAEFISHARQDVPALVKEVEILRKALSFYCDISKFSEISKRSFNSQLSRDSGKIARQALKGESNE